MSFATYVPQRIGRRLSHAILRSMAGESSLTSISRSPWKTVPSALGIHPTCVNAQRMANICPFSIGTALPMSLAALAIAKVSKVSAGFLSAADEKSRNDLNHLPRIALTKQKTGSRAAGLTAIIKSLDTYKGLPLPTAPSIVLRKLVSWLLGA